MAVATAVSRAWAVAMAVAVGRAVVVAVAVAVAVAVCVYRLPMGMQPLTLVSLGTQRRCERAPVAL